MNFFRSRTNSAARRPSSVPPPARRRGRRDDDEEVEYDHDDDGEEGNPTTFTPHQTTTTTMMKKKQTRSSSSTPRSRSRGAVTTGTADGAGRRGRSHSRSRFHRNNNTNNNNQEEEEDDEDEFVAPPKPKPKPKLQHLHNPQQPQHQRPEVVVEAANEDASLMSVAAAADELEEQQQQQQQQRLHSQLRTSHNYYPPPQSTSTSSSQYPTSHHSYYADEPPPIRLSGGGAAPKPVFLRYEEPPHHHHHHHHEQQEEEEEVVHYMVKKKTTSRRHNPATTTTTYHYKNHQQQQQQHQYHPSPSSHYHHNNNNHNTSTSSTSVDVAFLQTQLRDAQRVVRAVLNVGDAPLDASASLRAIRHFAALQKEHAKVQKEYHLTHVQKQELEQQWTTVVLEKNQQVLHNRQLQAQLEQLQLEHMKVSMNAQMNQQQVQMNGGNVVVTTTTMEEDNVSTLPDSPTKTVVELNTISMSSLDPSSFPHDDSNPPSSPSSRTMLLFLDQSSASAVSRAEGEDSVDVVVVVDNKNTLNNTNHNTKINNNSTHLEYQNALEVQLEDCQALLRQRHDELQLLQEQLADARTQLLQTSHHLTAQEEVQVLQQELETARQELDELEQERQLNMTEIVELSQQVLVLQQAQGQGQQAQGQVGMGMTTTTTTTTTNIQQEHIQQLETRITELETLLTTTQHELETQRQNHQAALETLRSERQESETHYSHQLRKLATRAAAQQASDMVTRQTAVAELEQQVQTLQQQVQEQVQRWEEQQQQYEQQYQAMQDHWQGEWDSAHAQLRELVVVTTTTTTTGGGQVGNGNTERGIAEDGNGDEKKQDDEGDGNDDDAQIIASSSSQPSKGSIGSSSSHDKPKSSLSSLLAQLKWQRDDAHRQHAIALQQVTDLQEELQQTKLALVAASQGQQQEQNNMQEKLQQELAQAQDELALNTKEIQQLQADADAQVAFQHRYQVAEERVCELEQELQRLQHVVDERERTLEMVQTELLQSKSVMATLEQDMGELQAELGAVAVHDVGQQLLHHVRSKRAAKAARSVDENNKSNDSSSSTNEESPDDDPFGTNQVDEKVALQAMLFRTQAQLRRQEDMYRLLADEADELRSTLASSQETMEELEQQRNFNQVKVTELSRMIRLRGKLSDVEEQLMTKINQCATLTTQVDALNFKMQENQRKMERLEQERQIHMDKLKELGQIWESHAMMLQAQKDMQVKVTEVIERWEASEARAEQMQMEREMSVERVTKLSFELAESRARVDELMEELDQERRASRSLHGGSLHSVATTFTKRSTATSSSAHNFWMNSSTNGGDGLDGSKHGTSSLSNNFFGMLAKSSAKTAILSGTTNMSDDVALRDADTAAGVHTSMNGEMEENSGGSESSLTTEQAQVSTIRKLMKQIEFLEDEKTRYADAVTVLESGLQQVQRENVVKSAKIVQMEKQLVSSSSIDSGAAAAIANTRSFDLEREQVVSQLKQSSHQFEGSMLALQAEMHELKVNMKKRDQERNGKVSASSS